MVTSTDDRARLERNLTLLEEPGRIHNLTEKEEQKLMQMWTHILVAMGLAPEELAPAKTFASISSETEKKGWFGRKKAVESDESAEAVKNCREDFKKAFDGKFNAEELNHTLWRMFRGDHPDNLMLRFLRARKWNVHDALAMLGETLKWRIDYKVEEIVSGGEALPREKNEDGVVLQYTSKKAYIWGKDLKGRPIVHVRPRFHDPKAQPEKDLEKFTVLIIEATRLCLRDPVDTAAVIFDLSDFKLSNMDYNAVKFIIKCFEAHYPESLGFILIHKAPWIFQGIWNIIKNWIDPVVASKISFTRNFNDMSKFIADTYIPKELGGKREFEYEYIEPIEGENELVKDTAKCKEIDEQRYKLGREFEQATLDWIEAKDDASRKAAQTSKNEIADKLRESYWDYDKYSRKKLVYDRQNLFATYEDDLSEQLRKTTISSAAPPPYDGTKENGKTEVSDTKGAVAADPAESVEV